MCEISWNGRFKFLYSQNLILSFTLAPATMQLLLVFRSECRVRSACTSICRSINEIPCHLILSQTSPGFTCLLYKSFENIAGKKEIARDEQFLLFLQCFLPIQIDFCHFHQIENCRLQTLSVWTSPKFVVW